MKVKKYVDFVNEAKSDDAAAELLKMFKEKPSVQMDKLPTEKGLYSLAGMKKYLSDKYTNLQIGQAHTSLQNNKDVDLKSTSIKNSRWSQRVPYWYLDLSKEEVDKIKDKYEIEESEKNKEEVEKKKATKRNAPKSAKKKQVIAKKEAEGDDKEKGVERKPGGKKSPGRPRKPPVKK